MTKMIAIVGQTASGKTDLALYLAQRFNGEIICADSRTIYRGMDIGTAKPDRAARALVPHHLLDVVEPGERFTVADFQRLARREIDQIERRGRLPFVVGGTGLYVDALIYDFDLRTEADPDLRAELEKLRTDELQERVDQLGVELNQSDYHNRRRLIRAIEGGEWPAGRRKRLPESVLLLGRAVSKEELQQRIEKRTEKMLATGWMEEVNTIIAQSGEGSEALTGTGYRSLAAVRSGQKTLMEAQAEIVRDTVQLAKRQLTWFKRNQDIQWVTSQAEAEGLVRQFLGVSRPGEV